MNVYVVGEALMIEAFELIGIAGRVPEPGQDVAELLADLARGKGAQLVLLSSALAALIDDEQLDQLAREWGCLVLEVPGVGQPAPDPAIFSKATRSAIGVAM